MSEVTDIYRQELNLTFENVFLGHLYAFLSRLHNFVYKVSEILSVISATTDRAAPGMANMSPIFPNRETYWSRIRRRILQNFQILIVSAIKICKQRLQTAAASDPLRPGIRLWTPMRTVPQTPGL